MGEGVMGGGYSLGLDSVFKIKNQTSSIINHQSSIVNRKSKRDTKPLHLQID
jgi:hypothetical protein